MKLKRMFMAGVMMFATVAGVMLAQPTYADEDPDTGGGTSGEVKCPDGSVRDTAPTLAACNLDSQDNDLMKTVNTIINVVVGVVGILAVFTIILGGINYVMSNGDPAKLKKAKDTILYGVIGLIVSLLAFSIVNFVLISVFGGNSSGGGSGGGSSAIEMKTPELG